jgi:Tol biopolymer transport system component
MTDYRGTLERELGRLSPPPRIPFDQLARRRDRKRRDERIRAGVVGLAVAIAVGWLGFSAIRSTSTPADHPTPSPTATDAVLRRPGEILRSSRLGPGDLLAVDPATGATRVIVDRRFVPSTIHTASWSPDGRWAAYDTGGRLWVVGSGQEPRQVASVVRNWVWSPTDARLAAISVAISVSSLIVVDPATGVSTDLASIVGDVTSDPVWSPDGTRILFGARGGALYSVDVATGTRTLLVRLPGEDLDSMDQMAWSPDGAHIAVMNDLEPGGGRLYVLDEDGSHVRVLVEDYQANGFSWSPDGSRLAYAESAGPGWRDLRVWVVSLDGSTASLVASHTNHAWRGGGGNPVWSPEGSEIAFETDRGFLRIDADGNGAATPIDGSVYRRWSGDDGSYICFCFG